MSCDYKSKCPDYSPRCMVTEDDLLKINDFTKFYSEVPRCMKELVLHAYKLGFAEGRLSYKEDLKMARDITIHGMEEERRIYYDNT